MVIKEIDQDDIDYVGLMIPPDVTENIGRYWYHGLTADNEYEEDLCGGIVWEYKNGGDDEADTESEIVWAAGRDSEILDALLGHYHDRIAAESALRSKFELPLDYNAKGIEASFSGCGYEIGKAESRDICVTVEQLKKLKLKKKKSPFYISALGSLDQNQFRNGVMNYIFHNRKGLLEDIACIQIDWFEPDISSCVVMDGKVKGFLLVHKRPSGILAVEVLFAVAFDPGKTILELIRFSVRETLKKYPPETKILIRRHNSLVKALTDKLFPAIKGEDVMTGRRQGNWEEWQNDNNMDI